MNLKLPWVSLALAGACLALMALPDAAWLELDAAHPAAGWRLWTAHLVHYSFTHALGDALAVLLLGSLAERHWGSRAIGLCLLAGAPLTSLAMLAAAPNMSAYRGASGLACMLAVLAAGALWRDRPHQRLLVCALAGLFILRAVSGLDGFSLPGGVAVAWQAHAFGALWGALCLFALRQPQATSAARAMQ